MPNESFNIAGQLHTLAFCSITATPTEGANAGKPYVFRRRTGCEMKGDAKAVYLKGPDDHPMGTGAGGAEPTWSIDSELEEARNFQKHLGGGNGDGFRGVHFTLVFTHAAPGRRKITDTGDGCLLLEDSTTGKAGDNTTIKLGGPMTAHWPDGMKPMNFEASLGATT